MAFLENLSNFVNTNDFGVKATYGSTLIDGIFDNAYMGQNHDGVEISGVQPRFLCPLSSLPTIEIDDIITIETVPYKVINKEPDGTGMITLWLENRA